MSYIRKLVETYIYTQSLYTVLENNEMSFYLHGQIDVLKQIF